MTVISLTLNPNTNCLTIPQQQPLRAGQSKGCWCGHVHNLWYRTSQMEVCVAFPFQFPYGGTSDSWHQQHVSCREQMVWEKRFQVFFGYGWFLISSPFPLWEHLLLSGGSGSANTTINSLSSTRKLFGPWNVSWTTGSELDPAVCLLQLALTMPLNTCRTICHSNKPGSRSPTVIWT